MVAVGGDMSLSSVRSHAGATSPNTEICARREGDKAETPVQIPPECRNKILPFLDNLREKRRFRRKNEMSCQLDIKRLSYSLEKNESNWTNLMPYGCEVVISVTLQRT